MKMLEHFQSEKYVFIVTEYIPNGTLLELIIEYYEQEKKFTEKVQLIILQWLTVY